MLTLLRVNVHFFTLIVVTTLCGYARWKINFLYRIGDANNHSSVLELDGLLNPILLVVKES